MTRDLFMWIGWHQVQLQVSRLVSEVILLLSLLTFVPYTIGRNYYFQDAHVSSNAPWYWILGYFIALLIPWIIGLISFLVENAKYHHDTDNSWWQLLKKRKLSFLKVSLFFERIVAFVLVVLSSSELDAFKHLSTPYVKSVLDGVFIVWLAIFGMLTMFRFMVRRAQMMQAKEDASNDDK